ncbi:hypothetical protein FOZ60_016039 [Perkinsus olseni]|uniref:Uncharacterized protein n=1 Tax=Perkinsus olseni TaxID=32597 RepID=A0A7J6N5N4_PEROL|nr:hypothetical protein FOZ60_016039 [Perkinsus olseni]
MTYDWYDYNDGSSYRPHDQWKHRPDYEYWSNSHNSNDEYWNGTDNKDWSYNKDAYNKYRSGYCNSGDWRDASSDSSGTYWSAAYSHHPNDYYWYDNGPFGRDARFRDGVAVTAMTVRLTVRRKSAKNPTDSQCMTLDDRRRSVQNCDTLPSTTVVPHAVPRQVVMLSQDKVLLNKTQIVMLSQDKVLLKESRIVMLSQHKVPCNESRIVMLPQDKAVYNESQIVMLSQDKVLLNKTQIVMLSQDKVLLKESRIVMLSQHKVPCNESQIVMLSQDKVLLNKTQIVMLSQDKVLLKESRIVMLSQHKMMYREIRMVMLPQEKMPYSLVGKLPDKGSEGTAANGASSRRPYHNEQSKPLADSRVLSPGGGCLS